VTQPEPYKITLHKTRFGNLDVEVSHDLCWAQIFYGTQVFECLGSTNPFWLMTHDRKGSQSTPLERLLHEIRTGRNPDTLGAEGLLGHESWLKGEGRGIVLAWAAAHKYARHFCEYPHDLRDALKDEVVSRWKQEKVDCRRLQLQGYIPHSDHARLGIETPPPLRQPKEGGDLIVPF